MVTIGGPTVSGRKRKWIAALAVLYVGIMVYLLLCRRPWGAGLPYRQLLAEHLNLAPFRTIRRFIWVFTHSSNKQLLLHASINIYGNIFLFLPLGLFPPLLWARMQRFWKTALLATGVMVCVEVLQMLLLVGTCDIDDVMLNVLGASMGYGAYKLLTRKERAAEE